MEYNIKNVCVCVCDTYMCMIFALKGHDSGRNDDGTEEKRADGDGMYKYTGRGDKRSEWKNAIFIFKKNVVRCGSDRKT